MTVKKKSCVNCAYLGQSLQTVSIGGREYTVNAVSLNARVLRGGVGEEGFDSCFHNQWSRNYGFHEPGKAILEEAKKESPEEDIILQINHKTISLHRYSCKHFYPYAKLGGRTLKQCDKEQQEKKQTRRAWIGIVIAIFTAIGAIATAFLTWESK